MPTASQELSQISSVVVPSQQGMPISTAAAPQMVSPQMVMPTVPTVSPQMMDKFAGAAPVNPVVIAAPPTVPMAMPTAVPTAVATPPAAPSNAASGGMKFDPMTGQQLPKFDPMTGKQNWW